MTNQEIKTVGQTIAQETQIGGNTAARVGGVVEGIGVALDNKDAANGYYQATINGGIITVNAPNYLLGTGGNLRIKMPSAGTTASTLTIGNANAVQLWYNGAAVSSDNTWDAGEIISVFYDGTRFMASNAQGGGSAMGNKRLYGRSGYNTLLNVGIGNTVGAAIADPPIVTYEQKVNEGDVICITAQGANAGRCWGFIDSNRTLLAVEDAGVFCNNKVLVVPAGVDKVVFNALVTDISGIKGYPDYEWYYAKAGSVGAHEMLTEAYLYGELISYAAIQDTLMSKFISDELYKSMLNLSVKASAATPVNNPLNLKVGNLYRIVIKLSAVATGSSKGFWLRQTYNRNNPNKLIAEIPVGKDTVDFEYTPPEDSNYQYISAWTSSGAFTYSVYIYEKKQVNKVPKIYDNLGYNDNGSISQKALTEILNKGTFETLIETNIDTSILTKASGSLGSGKAWLFKANSNHVIIPCTEGDEFNLTVTANNFWGWLRDYTIPKDGDSILYTSDEDRHWYPLQKPTVAPAGAKYLCLVTRNGDGTSSTWTGTSKIKASLYDILNGTVSKKDFEDSLDTKIAQFKSEFSSDANKYIFTPSSYIPINESREVYGSTYCYQGCALYGNYLVSISNPSITQLCIYNLETKTVIADSIALPAFPNTRFHGNTLSFSNTKYDANDEFPLLYCCTGSTITTSSSEGQVYVVRIVNNEGVYSTELIQTITLDFGIINGWNEFVVDAENNRAWITGSSNRFYICVALPSIGEDATINNDTPLIDSFDVRHARTGVSTGASGQGKFFYKGRIYSANGVPNYSGQGVDALYISVDNTLTHCREAIASLKNYGITQEPEACFIWRNELYVVMRLGTIYKLIQN